MAAPAPESPPAADIPKLTFFQRYFTRPLDKDPEKANLPHNRRFAFASSGFIAAALAGLIVLAAVIAAAVAVTVTRNNENQAAAQQAFADSANPEQNIGGSDSQHTSPSDPIHVAIDSNFPDPAILHINNSWYAWGTNSGSGILHQIKENLQSVDAAWGAVNIQVATSKDFSNWTVVSPGVDALPSVGTWSVQGRTENPPHVPKANTWAPSVIQRPMDRKWVMYYSSTLANSAKLPHHGQPHCVGAAVAEESSPEGPYTPDPSVLACPASQGGAIDPAAFVDEDNSIYLTYKIDGNSMGHGGECGNMVKPYTPTPIQLQKLDPNGTTPYPNSPPITLLDLDHDLDGPLIEAPSLIRSNEGIYFLFFSSGCTRAPDYDIKYATSKNLTGPYTRAPNNEKLLKTGDYGLVAPGSAAVTQDGSGGYRMAFHARVNAKVGGIRVMFTAGVKLDGEKASLYNVQQAGSS